MWSAVEATSVRSVLFERRRALMEQWVATWLASAETCRPVPEVRCLVWSGGLVTPTAIQVQVPVFWTQSPLLSQHLTDGSRAHEAGRVSASSHDGLRSAGVIRARTT